MIIRIYFYNNNNYYYYYYYPGECSQRYQRAHAFLDIYIKVVCEMWLQFVLYLFFLIS